MLDGGGKSAESSQKMAVMTFISTHTRDGIKELYKEVCGSAVASSSQNRSYLPFSDLRVLGDVVFVVTLPQPGQGGAQAVAALSHQLSVT